MQLGWVHLQMTKAPTAKFMDIDALSGNHHSLLYSFLCLTVLVSLLNGFF